MLKIKDFLNHFIRSWLKTLFLVSAGIIFANALSAFINPVTLSNFREATAAPLQIIYAELIGFISPGPRYMIYPILIKLVEYGAGAGIIISLISGHVLIEPATVFVEAGFLGYRFPVKRFVISFIITFFAGMFTYFLTEALQWKIF